MSAGLITFSLFTNPWAWTGLRLLLGLLHVRCYVTAESWLNAASTNETRGKVLSTYMIAQTLGIIGAQYLLTLGDAATSVLFIGASIMVSILFGPILLSVNPAPVAEAARRMSLPSLFRSSLLGTVGILLPGAVYATQSGMAVVFGTQIDLTADLIALLVAMLFGGALLLQYPIGWLSDQTDRRKSAEDMPAASGGLVLTLGVGAILGKCLGRRTGRGQTRSRQSALTLVGLRGRHVLRP